MAELKTVYDYLKEINPSLRKKIYPILVSVADILEKYKVHTQEISENKQKSPLDFLKENDPLIEMMVKELGCYDDILWLMKDWVKS